MLLRTSPAPLVLQEALLLQLRRLSRTRQALAISRLLIADASDDGIGKLARVLAGLGGVPDEVEVRVLVPSAASASKPTENQRSR